MGENTKKLEVGPLVTTDVRTLGTTACPDKDTEVRCRKAWAAFHRSKNRIGTCKRMSWRQKGAATSSLFRNTLVFGIKSRGTTAKEEKKLNRTDEAIMARLSGMKDWMRRKLHVGAPVIRTKYGVPPLLPWLRYLRAKLFGHVMRKTGSRARQALLGVFIPRRADGVPDSAIFYNQNNDSTKPASMKRGDTFMSCVETWVCAGGGVGVQDKRLLYAAASNRGL
jgi:hypothetical protein